MAIKTVLYTLLINAPTKGQIGSLIMRVEDGKVMGVDVDITGKMLVQEDFVAINAAYNDLKGWATVNGYTWG